MCWLYSQKIQAPLRACGGTYFKFAQGMVHFDYLQHVFDVFKSAGHVNMGAPSHGTSTVNGVVHKWIQFSTVSLSS